MRQNLIDSLESRRLFSFTIAANTTEAAERPYLTGQPTQVVTTFKVSKTGTLFVSGTSTADRLQIIVQSGSIVADSMFVLRTTAPVSGSGSSGNVISLHTQIDLSSLRHIKRVDVAGLGGNDHITVSADVPVNVRGSAGNDQLYVFSKSRIVDGGSGDNEIRQADYGLRVVEAINRSYVPGTPTQSIFVEPSDGIFIPSAPIAKD